MRFQILHEIPGRIRLRADVRSMSIEEADILEAWIKTLPGVDQTTVHERTRSVTVLYHGNRGELCRALASFSYEHAEKSLGPQPSGSRLMNRKYKEKLVFLVLRHFLRRLLLPAPIRRVSSLCRTCPRILKGARTAMSGHLTVEVLDGIAIGTALVTGDYTTAGSVNFLLRVGEILEEGSCVIRVTHATGENRYDRIVRMIEDSERLKSGVEKRADTLADSLVPWCLGGSILTWILTGNTTRAISVLMVDFSCALKLSMPLSVLSAMREASSRHITVKGGRFMEKISEADTVIFDKTGTLTKACPTVAEVVPFNGENEREMLRMAACLEEHFPHSVANAVVKAAEEQKLSHREMHSEVEYVVAHGIASRINGRRVVIGSSHFVFEDEGVQIRPEDRERFHSLPESVSWLYFGIGGVLSAAIGISNPPRPEARTTVESLRKAGIAKTVMLTGDNRKVAGSIASELSLDDYRAEVLPEDKAAYIHKEHEAGRTVIMVGDGINDTPALSLSDVGIAIGSGAVIAREVADVTIEAEDIRELVWLKRLSDALMRRIHRNYRFVMGFNGTLIALGAFVWITPALSAFLHNSSTILLSMNCLTALLENERENMDDRRML